MDKETEVKQISGTKKKHAFSHFILEAPIRIHNKNNVRDVLVS